MRVEDAYIDDELTTEEQATYDEEYAEELAQSEEATGDVPPFVSATFSAPYALGQPFVTMLLNQDGNDARRRGVRRAAVHRGAPLRPGQLPGRRGLGVRRAGLRGRRRAVRRGALRRDRAGTCSSPSASTPRWRFDAALGWDGDCVRGGRARRGDVRAPRRSGATPKPTRTRWPTRWPSGSTPCLVGRPRSIEVDGHPVLEACDPGEDLDLELTGRSETSLFLPNLWGYLVADAASAVRTRRGAVLRPDRGRRARLRGHHRPGGRGVRRGRLPGHPRRRRTRPAARHRQGLRSSPDRG